MAERPSSKRSSPSSRGTPAHQHGAERSSSKRSSTSSHGTPAHHHGAERSSSKRSSTSSHHGLDRSSSKRSSTIAFGPPSHHGSTRVGSVENRHYTKEEHLEWAKKLWNRIDRDHKGLVGLDDLNCDEFQDVLHSVIAPENDGEGCHATYGRSEMHIQQALDFLLRKAHTHEDGTLDFKEFVSFTRMLRNQQGDESNRVHLIFALFDLDGSNTIDQEEFIGIYRFFHGHNPCLIEVRKAFEQMDKYDKKEITRSQFIRWLKTDAPEEFRHHAEGIAVSEPSEASVTSETARKKAKPKRKIHRPAPGILPRADTVPTWTDTWHVFWNDRFRGRDHSLMNPTCGERMKHYFSAPATLPELDRFYNMYSGFEKHKKRLHRPPSPIHRPLLSTQSKTKEVNPERAAPGGTARSSKGDLILWDNDWPDKASDFKKKPQPGTLLYRCPGKPPPILLLGRDAEHLAYRARVLRGLPGHTI